MVTATGTKRSVVDPSPIWPTLLAPQQYTAPVAVRAQLYPDAASIDVKVTPAGMVAAVAFMTNPLFEPLPISPLKARPQQ
jgi:hypothetical protein